MFRRLPASLPKDAEFKSDLKELGYFINEKSQVMQIKHPDQGYVFKVYSDERYNIMHREALNGKSRAPGSDKKHQIDRNVNRLHPGRSYQAGHQRWPIPPLPSPTLLGKTCGTPRAHLYNTTVRVEDQAAHHRRPKRP